MLLVGLLSAGPGWEHAGGRECSLVVCSATHNWFCNLKLPRLLLTAAPLLHRFFSGLGCTLLWLAMARKALPALPISIALAVTFYFVSRFVLEPVLLPQVLELMYY